MPRQIILTVLLFLVAASKPSAQTVQTNLRINGKTVNAVTGQALARVEVSIAKAEQPDSPLQKMLTADDGEFAFTGIEPGKYLLAGERNGFRKQGYEEHGFYASAVVVGRGLISENLIFRLRPDARIKGTIVDEENEPVSNAVIYLFRADADAGLRQTFLEEQVGSDDRGYYHFAHLESGWYFLAVSAQPWFGLLAQGREDGGGLSPANRAIDLAYPTTFYPGVTDLASASQIVLNEGEEFTADFSLTAITALRVRINHLNTDPEHPRGISLSQRVFGTTITPPSRGQTMVDDSDEIRGIPPGKYVFDVESYGPTPSTRSTAVNLTANMSFDADDASAMPSIHGVIRMDGGLNLRPPAFVRLWNSNETVETPIAPNGEFSFAPDVLVPGNYSVFVMSGMNSIIGKLSATGAKVAGQSIRITGARPIELSVELSRTLSTVNGTARRNGQPFSGAMILLVPENPEANLPLFRRDQSDSDGTFTLPDVLPGRYKLLAIENGWDLEWANPALLKTRLDHAESTDVRPNMTYQTVVNVE